MGVTKDNENSFSKSKFSIVTVIMYNVLYVRNLLQIVVKNILITFIIFAIFLISSYLPVTAINYWLETEKVYSYDRTINQ